MAADEELKLIVDECIEKARWQTRADKQREEDTKADEEEKREASKSARLGQLAGIPIVSKYRLAW